jgi:hypothetical protein
MKDEQKQLIDNIFQYLNSEDQNNIDLGIVLAKGQGLLKEVLVRWVEEQKGRLNETPTIRTLARTARSKFKFNNCTIVLKFDKYGISIAETLISIFLACPDDYKKKSYLGQDEYQLRFKIQYNLKIKI